MVDIFRNVFKADPNIIGISNSVNRANAINNGSIVNVFDIDGKHIQQHLDKKNIKKTITRETVDGKDIEYDTYSFLQSWSGSGNNIEKIIDLHAQHTYQRVYDTAETYDTVNKLKKGVIQYSKGEFNDLIFDFVTKDYFKIAGHEIFSTRIQITDTDNLLSSIDDIDAYAHLFDILCGGYKDRINTVYFNDQIIERTNKFLVMKESVRLKNDLERLLPVAKMYIYLRDVLAMRKETGENTIRLLLDIVESFIHNEYHQDIFLYYFCNILYSEKGRSNNPNYHLYYHDTKYKQPILILILEKPVISDKNEDNIEYESIILGNSDNHPVMERMLFTLKGDQLRIQMKSPNITRYDMFKYINKGNGQIIHDDLKALHQIQYYNPPLYTASLQPTTDNVVIKRTDDNHWFVNDIRDDDTKKVRHPREGNIPTTLEGLKNIFDNNYQNNAEYCWYMTFRFFDRPNNTYGKNSIHDILQSAVNRNKIKKIYTLKLVTDKRQNDPTIFMMKDEETRDAFYDLLDNEPNLFMYNIFTKNELRDNCVINPSSYYLSEYTNSYYNGASSVYIFSREKIFKYVDGDFKIFPIIPLSPDIDLYFTPLSQDNIEDFFKKTTKSVDMDFYQIRKSENSELPNVFTSVFMMMSYMYAVENGALNLQKIRPNKVADFKMMKSILINYNLAMKKIRNIGVFEDVTECIESVKKIKIRPEQATILKKMYTQIKERSTSDTPIYEMLMGSGKSSVITPLLTYITLEETKMTPSIQHVVIVVPDHMMTNTRKQVVEDLYVLRSNSRYTYDVRCINDVRRMSENYDEGVVDLIKFCFRADFTDNNRRTICIITPGSLKSMILNCIESNIDIQTNLNNPETLMIIDEIDHIINPFTSEFNYPINNVDANSDIISLETIDSKYLRALIDYIYTMDTTNNNNTPVSRLFCIKNDIAPFVLDDINDAGKAFAAAVNKVISPIMNMKVNSDYGFGTLPYNEYYAIPYTAINSPDNKSTFQDKLYTCILTIFMYKNALVGFNSSERSMHNPVYLRIINTLKTDKDDNMEKIKKLKHTFDENLQNEFMEHYDKNTSDDDIIGTLFNDDDLRNKVFSEYILYVIKNYLRSNNVMYKTSSMDILSSDFAYHRIGFSGTTNIPLPKTAFKVTKNEFSRIEKSNPDNSVTDTITRALDSNTNIHRIKCKDKTTMLNDISSIIKSRNIDVLIDIGSFFHNGESNEFVAGKVFPEHDHAYLSESDEWVEIKKPIKNSLTDARDKKLYYSHKHTIGIDYPDYYTTAKTGLITLNSKNRMTEVLQGVMRMRQIFESDGSQSWDHTLHIVCFEDDINKGGTLTDLLEKNEKSYVDNMSSSMALQLLMAYVKQVDKENYKVEVKDSLSGVSRYEYIRTTIEKFEDQKYDGIRGDVDALKQIIIKQKDTANQIIIERDQEQEQEQEQERDEDEDEEEEIQIIREPDVVDYPEISSSTVSVLLTTDYTNITKTIQDICIRVSIYDDVCLFLSPLMTQYIRNVVRMVHMFPDSKKRRYFLLMDLINPVYSSHSFAHLHTQDDYDLKTRNKMAQSNLFVYKCGNNYLVTTAVEAHVIQTIDPANHDLSRYTYKENTTEKKERHIDTILRLVTWQRDSITDDEYKVIVESLCEMASVKNSPIVSFLLNYKSITHDKTMSLLGERYLVPGNNNILDAISTDTKLDDGFKDQLRQRIASMKKRDLIKPAKSRLFSRRTMAWIYFAAQMSALVILITRIQIELSRIRHELFRSWRGKKRNALIMHLAYASAALYIFGWKLVATESPYISTIGHQVSILKILDPKFTMKVVYYIYKYLSTFLERSSPTFTQEIESNGIFNALPLIISPSLLLTLLQKHILYLNIAPIIADIIEIAVHILLIDESSDDYENTMAQALTDFTTYSTTTLVYHFMNINDILYGIMRMRNIFIMLKDILNEISDDLWESSIKKILISQRARSVAASSFKVLNLVMRIATVEALWKYSVIFKPVIQLVYQFYYSHLASYLKYFYDKANVRN